VNLLLALLLQSGLGFGVAHQQGAEYATESVQALQPSVWYNWLHNDVCLADARCMPMVFTLGPNDAAIEVGKANPGRLFLLGNEPDLEHGYTYTEPTQAAEFTRQWQNEVGGEWACCGVMVWPIEWRPQHNWQTWMDAYLAAGGAIPTHYHIHIYGVNVAQWYEQVQAFRAWAIANNVDRPIIVSETAIDWSTAEYNATLLDEVAHRLDTDPMLYAVMWYSVRDYHGMWPSTDLRTGTGELTPLEIGRAHV
jgi:hypothetical protein